MPNTRPTLNWLVMMMARADFRTPGGMAVVVLAMNSCRIASQERTCLTTSSRAEVALAGLVKSFRWGGVAGRNWGQSARASASRRGRFFFMADIGMVLHNAEKWPQGKPGL